MIAAGGAQATVMISDGGFEAPNLGAGGYTYPGSVGAWTFNGASLINASGGSAWYGGAGPAGNDQNYQVTLDSLAVSGVLSTVGGSDFSFNALTLSGLTAGNAYTLGFQGLSGGADKTAFIDNVLLQDSIFPPPPVAPSIT